MNYGTYRGPDQFVVSEGKSDNNIYQIMREKMVYGCSKLTDIFKNVSSPVLSSYKSE